MNFKFLLLTFCHLLYLGEPITTSCETEAIKYYEKACEYNLGRGCYNAGIVRLQQEQCDAESQTKAFSLHDRACRMGVAEGCYNIHTAFLLGRKQPKDLPKAFSYATAGCSLNHAPSCSNLSLMYRHGHGTEKNEILADEIRKKTIKITNELKNPGPQVKLNQ